MTDLERINDVIREYKQSYYRRRRIWFWLLGIVGAIGAFIAVKL